MDAQIIGFMAGGMKEDAHEKCAQVISLGW